MNVIIEEIVSRVRTTSSDAMLSAKALRMVVSAVMDAIEADRQRGERRNEELSLMNHQERVRPGR